MKFFYIFIITIISLFFLIKRKDVSKNLGKLSGEWIVENSTEGNIDNVGNIYYFYGDSIRIFDNEYLYGKYFVDDSILTYEINGYPAKQLIFKNKGNFMQFFDPEKNIHLNLKSYGAFDFLLFMLLFLVGIVSIVVLVIVFDNLYVWIVSSSWPKILSKAINTKINVTKSEKYQKDTNLSDYQFKKVERGVLGFGYRITNKYYSPFVKIEYRLNDINYNSDNSSSYNHGTYTESESNYWIEEWKKNGVLIRVNPNNPDQVFFGWKHFPFTWTILLFIVFTILSISFFASIEMILNIFNLEFIKLNGKTSILVFIIPLVFLIYFVINIFKNLLFNKKK